MKPISTTKPYSQRTKLQNIGKGKSIHTCIRIISLCKDNCVVQIDRRIFHMVIVFWSIVNAVKVFCATRSLKQFNSMHVSIESFLYKILLHTLQSQWSNSSRGILQYYRIIRHHFPMPSFQRPLDLNPCNFYQRHYF